MLKYTQQFKADSVIRISPCINLMDGEFTIYVIMRRYHRSTVYKYIMDASLTVMNDETRQKKIDPPAY